MKLTIDMINKIQVHLEPGYVLELSVEDGQLQVQKRPPIQDAILFPPVLLSADQSVTMQINAKLAGQDPISILNQAVEPNTWICGILTSRGISQEMRSES